MRLIRNGLGRSDTADTLSDIPDGGVIKLRRHPLRWASAILVLYLVVSALVSFGTNERVGWDMVGHYLFHPSILKGFQTTLILTAAAMAVGIALGVVLALMRISRNPVLSWSASGYIWFFRGTPLLVQLIFWYNFSAIYPTIALRIFGFTIFEGNANYLIGVWTAALIGLAFNEAAYVSEVFRGGLLSVNKGQREAAQALGMTQSLVFRRVIAPQAFRVIVPPLGNQFISMLKMTSLVSVIALPELLYSAQLIYAMNFRIIPLLIVVSIWYLLATSILSVLQHFLERAYGRGFSETTHRRRLKGTKTKGIAGEMEARA